ncbi:MAG: hypothetical protein J6Y60_10445 [Treponema sp.]|nr:hypothetical protein [Treponema sp.]
MGEAVKEEEKETEKVDSVKQKVDELKRKTKAARKAKKQAAVKKIAESGDNELLQILVAQNDVLDCMLTQQKKIHDSVKERKWVELENCINNMKAYSDAFVNLDQCRENFVGDNKDLYLMPEVRDVFASVRTKLSKSKIENSALATYVTSTREFVDGILENCVPQSRTKVYGRNGKIIRPTAESVVLDALV